MQAEWFAGRLRELREAKGLTQRKLAERTGLTTDGIAKLERSARSPTWETVIALCQALGVEVGEFTKKPKALPNRRRGRPRKAQPEERTPEGENRGTKRLPPKKRG
jgi:transcriptional regulator with XRE-family HTH domain